MIQGNRIREIRKKKNLTLKDLAEKTGLSTSLLSQIERGMVDPTVTTFWKICTSLEISMNTFFTGLEETGIIVRKEQRKIIELSDAKVRYHELSPNRNGKIEYIIVEIQPGEMSDKELVAHDGEESGYILQGELKVILEDKEFFLKEGDSIQFSSTIPHRYVNPGDDVSLSIWAMAPY